MPKSEHEKAEIRRQTEARRQADKDRTAHQAKRGEKANRQPPLAHLSRSGLNPEELPAALAMMQAESDRGLAVMGAALVGEALTDAILSQLRNAKDHAALFHDQGAPFGTLRAKTVTALAMGVIGDAISERTDAIRQIRNQFSHSLRPIDFDTPQVRAACKPLSDYLLRALGKLGERTDPKPRDSYLFACLWTSLTIWAAIAMIEKGSDEPLKIITEMIKTKLMDALEANASSGERSDNYFPDNFALD